MKIKIKVTKEIQQRAMDCGHIDGKASEYTENCEVAEAVREIFPLVKVCHASVRLPGVFAILFTNGDEISLPYEAERRIKLFDKLSPCDRIKQEPYEFEIDVPEQIIDRIGLSEVHRILKESKTLELV